jgi:hypothetical protein
LRHRLVARVGLTDSQPSKRQGSAGLVPFDLVDFALQRLERPGAGSLVAVVKVIFQDRIKTMIAPNRCLGKQPNLSYTATYAIMNLGGI